MCVCVLSRFSHVLLFVTLCSVALQVLLSLGVSRQKYCSGLHVLLQGMLLTQGSNPGRLLRHSFYEEHTEILSVQLSVRQA